MKPMSRYGAQRQQEQAEDKRDTLLAVLLSLVVIGYFFTLRRQGFDEKRGVAPRLPLKEVLSTRIVTLHEAHFSTYN